MSEKFQRDATRFTVAHLPDLQFRLGGISMANSLVSLSSGGCGVYCAARDPRLEPSEDENLKRRVNLEFEWEGITASPIAMVGLILYRKEVILKEEKIQYYGLQFIPADQPKLQPIIDELHSRLEKGEAKTH